MIENKFIFDLQRFDGVTSAGNILDNEFVGGGEAAFSLDVDIKSSDEEAEDYTEVPNKEVSASGVNAPLQDEDAAVAGEVYNTTDANGNIPIVEGSDTSNVSIKGLVLRKNSLGVTYFQVVLEAITELQFSGTSDVTLSNGLAFQSQGATVNFNLNNGVFTGCSFGRGGRFSFGRRAVSDVLYDIETGISIEPTGAGTFVANDGDLESITLSEAGKITVNGDYKFDFVDPNGTSNTVNIKNATGDVVIQYTSDGNTILDLSGLTSTGNTIRVVSVGGADYLIPPTAENTLKISSTTYTYDNESGAAQFILNSSGKASGFIFGGNDDQITVPKNASFTYQDEDGNALDFGISGSARNYTIVRKADDVYEMQVFGSAVVSDSDTTLTFKTTRALSNAVSVYFDNAGNILSVDGLDNLGVRDTMAVDSSDITSADEGLAIGDPTGTITGYISVSNGDFTFKRDRTGNQTITVDPGVTVYGVNPKPVSDGGISIINDNDGVIITGGKGDDTIDSIGYSTDINAGAGSDSIINSGDNVTISGGSDNDSISNYGANVLFKYAIDDGNDIIEGFDATSTLQIGDGTDTYSAKKSGKDIIVTVEDNEITLKDTTGLSTFNINTIDIFKPSWTLSGTTATYGTPKKTSVTVTGVNSIEDNALTLNNKVVTISAKALGTDEVTINKGYKLELGNDVTKSTSTEATGWKLNNTTATYKTASISAGYKLASNSRSISYVEASGGDTLTVKGVKSIDGLSINDKIVTVSNASLDTSKVTLNGDDYTLALGSDVSQPTAKKETWSLRNSTATCKQTTTAGYDLASDGKSINYSNKVTATLAKVNGVTSLDGISLDDKTVTISESSLGTNNVTISDGYNLALDDDVTKSETTEAGWTLDGTTATYKSASNSAGYALEDNQISYKAAHDGETLFTVSGVTSLDGLSLDDTTVTISGSSLGKKNITISDGYTLKLADDVSAPTTKDAAFSIDGTTATYKSSYETAGYALDSDAKSITYSKATSAKTLATVTGVKSVDGLKVNDTTITVDNSALNQDSVTVSDGYTLALADDVTLSEKTAAGWSLNDKTATYKTAATTAGYKFEDNQINYVKASGGKTSVTVDGVTSTDGLSLDNKTVTISESSLGTDNVTISDGYTLKLADDVSKSETTAANWSLNNSVATYTDEQTTAGYKLEDNQISYVEASGGDTFTVNGVKSTDGLAIEDNVVTVSKASLGTNKVTISNDNYTLALDDDVTKSTIKNAAWSLKSSTATYNQTTTAGYLLEDNAITYTKKGTTTLATVKGVKSTNGLKVSGKVITVSKASLGTSKVTLSGDGYTLKLNSDVTKPTSKNASWTLKNSTATYKGSMTAGYTLANDSKSITYSKATSAKTLATIKGAKSANGLSVSDNVIKLKNSALANKVTVGGSYEFDFQSDYKKATITGSGSADTITVRGSDIKLNGGSGADSLSGGSSNDSINGGAGNDVIFGNKGKDTLVGGAGNDNLWGGAGDDSLYGGAGNDTFIYKPGEGTDTIFDYQSGDMLTILQSDGSEGGTFTSSSFKSGNLTLAIDGGGSVIFDSVTKSNSFNINGNSYKISGSKLTQK